MDKLGQRAQLRSRGASSLDGCGLIPIERIINVCPDRSDPI
jgi:hypothetical protein